MTTRAFGCFAFVSAGFLAGCAAAFPRYTTTLLEAPPGLVQSGDISPAPDFVQRISPIRAELPQHTRDGRMWDSDSAPDPYVVIYRNGERVFRSPTVHDSFRPTWDPAQVFVDLRIHPTDVLRIQLFDDDGISSDPVALYETHGVPTSAMNGGEWVLQLEAGTLLQMQAVPPPAHLGMGVTYDYHSDSLVVVEVEEAGPAYSAGLRPGDHIVAIEGRRVATMNEGGARQAMDHGSMSAVNMTVQHGNGHQEDITVRRDAVYPAH